MSKYKIIINRDECISCGNCYTVDPVHFEADDDGFAKVIGGEIEGNLSEGIINDDAIENAREAEDACPVSVIEVEEI